MKELKTRIEECIEFATSELNTLEPRQNHNSWLLTKGKINGYNHILNIVNARLAIKIEIPITFVGIDGWNRPIFKVIDKKEYYGSVTKLFDFDSTLDVVLNYFQDHIDELEYFGTSFDCEPQGGINPNIKLKII